MSVTYYASNKILDESFGSTGFLPASSYYVGLSTTTILADGTGATEPVGNNYARVAISNNKTTFTTASNGSLATQIAVEFAESSGSWGTISHVFFADALSGGNIWFFEALSSPKIVQANTIVRFDSGTIVISMTN